MNIPSTVRTFLATSGVRFKGRRTTPAESFEATVAKAEIPLAKLVKPVLLKSGPAYLMAVIRGDQEIDLGVLNKLFNREFTLCDTADLVQLFPNCDQRALPPLAEPYGLRAIVDKSVSTMPNLYFAAGCEGLFIATSGEAFVKTLHKGSWSGRNIAHRVSAGAAAVSVATAMREKVEQIDGLPVMPGLAAEITRLRHNPYAQPSELAAVIEQDPSLSAQVISYANSPIYGQPRGIRSVQQAIVDVLGMDFVEDLTFGLSLGKAFNNPKEGPLGLNHFWQHSLYCAALTQALCGQIEGRVRPLASMGYLAGLLHNFGHLLLGHLFPAQFDRLNRALLTEPQRSLMELEHESIAVSHTELGLWLMEAWEMPREIAEAVGEHHNPDHRGDHSLFANLVYIANALLKRHGIGDAESMEIPAALLQRFGLDEVKLELALATILEGREGLEFMAAKMAA